MKTETTTLEIQRRVKASPETVFSFFTDPEKYRLWQGMDAQLDPRPGGSWRVVMTGQSRMVAAGEYIAVEPPNRLVYTWGWEDAENFETPAREVPVGSSTVEVTFVPDGDATIVRVRHTGFPSERASSFHEWGWNHTLDRLEKAAVGVDPGHDMLADL